MGFCSRGERFYAALSRAWVSENPQLGSKLRGCGQKTVKSKHLGQGGFYLT
jgi:hypothetical protein